MPTPTTQTSPIELSVRPAPFRSLHVCPACNSDLRTEDGTCRRVICARHGMTETNTSADMWTATVTPSAPELELRRTWSTGIPFDSDTTFERTKSERRFGVEVETSDCPSHRRLRRVSSFACVEDGSVDGLEFVSVPMKGDNGLEEVSKLCQYAKDNEWRINSACGLHVHLDAGDLDHAQLFKVAWAYLLTYDLWSSFLPQSRKNNYYCAKHFFAPSSLDLYTNFENWIRDEVGSERYCWINFGAYLRHGTIELRNHTATLNADKINNWVRAHIRFIDAVKDMTMDEIHDKFNGTTQAEQFEHVAATWQTSYMREFYLARAHKFNYLSDVS